MLLYNYLIGLSAVLGMGIVVAMSVGILVLAVLLYYIFAKGMLCLMDRLREERGVIIEPYWLVWVPYAQWYVAGMIAKELDPEKRGYPLEWIALGVMLALGIIGEGFLAQALTIASYVLKGYLGYCIAGSLAPTSRNGYAILSIFLPQITYYKLRENEFQD